MKFEVSDLLFAGFPKYAMRDLSKEYGIEFFYEFGKDYYWDNEVARSVPNPYDWNNHLDNCYCRT